MTKVWDVLNPTGTTVLHEGRMRPLWELRNEMIAPVDWWVCVSILLPGNVKAWAASSATRPVIVRDPVGILAGMGDVAFIAASAEAQQALVVELDDAAGDELAHGIAATALVLGVDDRGADTPAIAVDHDGTMLGGAHVLADMRGARVVVLVVGEL
jgi:hypothetical protein